MDLEIVFQAAEAFHQAVIKTAMGRRELLNLLHRPGTFGVVSAYIETSKAENRDRHGRLLRFLQEAGYPHEYTKGKWESSSGQMMAEKSIVIRDVDFPFILALAEHFAQKAFIYKSSDGIIGMYYPERRVAEVAVDVNADPAFRLSLEKDLWSKPRGVSFEFDFLWGQMIPWDGRTPLSKREVAPLIQAGYLKPPGNVPIAAEE